MAMPTDDEPATTRLQPPPLDRLGVAELHAYIAELRAEIARTELEITRKEGHRAAADRFFGTPRT